MAVKLSIKVPLASSNRKPSVQAQEATSTLQALRTKPDEPSFARPLRDSTDYTSDYSDDEDMAPAMEMAVTGHGRQSVRRMTAALAEQDHMLPSPGEYELIGNANPFKGPSLASPSSPSSPVTNSNPTASSSSSSSSSSISSPASNLTKASPAVTKAGKSRWGGFWAPRRATPPQEVPAEDLTGRSGGRRWESTEETLLKLRREEEEIERIMAEEQEAALEKLCSLGRDSSADRGVWHTDLNFSV